MARSKIVALLQVARQQHDAITEAIADGNPQAAIAACLNEIETLVNLTDTLLTEAVRVTRRRT
jgi:DNA-binding GntR family transcriptional regulator